MFSKCPSALVAGTQIWVSRYTSQSAVRCLGNNIHFSKTHVDFYFIWLRQPICGYRQVYLVHTVPKHWRKRIPALWYQKSMQAHSLQSYFWSTLSRILISLSMGSSGAVASFLFRCHPRGNRTHSAAFFQHYNLEISEVSFECRQNL